MSWAERAVKLPPQRKNLPAGFPFMRVSQGWSIFISQRVAARLDDNVASEDIGALLTLTGLTQPVAAYNVALAANEPTLPVIEGRSPNRSLRRIALASGCFLTKARRGAAPYVDAFRATA